MEFQLRGEYIELIKLLKLMNLTDSGGQAKSAVEEELVLVNGERETRKRRKVRKGDVVEFAGVAVKVL